MTDGKYGPNTEAVERFAAWVRTLDTAVPDPDGFSGSWDMDTPYARAYADRRGYAVAWDLLTRVSLRPPEEATAAKFACAAIVVRDLLSPEHFALFTAPFADKYDFDAMAPREAVVLKRRDATLKPLRVAHALPKAWTPGYQEGGVFGPHGGGRAEPCEAEVRADRLPDLILTGRYRAVRGPGLESASLSTVGDSRPVAECVKGCFATYGAGHRGCMHRRAT